AFYETYKDRVGMASGSYVRLKRGAGDVPEFLDGVRSIMPQGFQPNVVRQADITVKTQRAIHLPGVALELFATVVGLVGLLMFAQALARELRWQAGDDDVLRAIGMTRWQRANASLLTIVPVAFGGAVVAVALA